MLLEAVGEWTSASLVIVIDTTAFGPTELLSLIVQVLGIVAVLCLTATVYEMVSFARFRLRRRAGCLMIIETGLIHRSRRLIRAGPSGI